jgi:hypothetical protein
MLSRFWQMLATKYRITKLLSLNLEGFGPLCGALYFRVYSWVMDRNLDTRSCDVLKQRSDHQGLSYSNVVKLLYDHRTNPADR